MADSWEFDEGAPITWRMDRAQAGHGAMGDMGVHLVDMVRWCFGEFARVFARGGEVVDAGVEQPVGLAAEVVPVDRVQRGRREVRRVQCVVHGFSSARARRHQCSASSSSFAMARQASAISD